MTIVSSALLIVTGATLALGLIYVSFRVDERSRHEFSAHPLLRTSLPLAVRCLQNIAKQLDALVFRSRPLFGFLLLAIAVPGFCQAVAANDSQKRVLILAGDSNDFPAVAKMDGCFRRTLTASSPFRLSYFQ